MRVVGVIPSRWGSSRFPGKSIAPIAGKPLVQWVIEACLRAEALSEVLLATDDERIALAVKGTGVRVVMTRPDHPTGTDRVAEAAEAADEDVVLNIQGDEPLIDPSLIDQVARVLLDDASLEMATASAPLTTLEELNAKTVVKLVLNAAGQALYFSRLPIPCQRDGPADLGTGLYRRHVGLYGYRGAFLKHFVETPPCALEQSECLEQLRALYLGAKIAVVEAPSAGVGVDCPEDVAVVEALLRTREAP